MDRWVKECRKALFWEVYWKTRVSAVRSETRPKETVGFILRGAKKCSAG